MKLIILWRIITGEIYRLRKKVDKKGIEREVLLKSLENIDKMLIRMAKITKGIHFFSRDVPELPMTRNKFSKIFEDSLVLFSQKVKSFNIELTYSFKEIEDIEINCRPTEISQALVNIILNAIDVLKKVPESEEKFIAINAYKKEESIFIEFKNSGPPIDLQRSTKIFEPFYTTKEVGEGVGIGLSISKGIMIAHNGDIYAKTEREKTVFVLQLPIFV